MTGRVEQRPNGRWYVVVELGRGADGKRRRKCYSSWPTKRDATKARDRILHEMRTGTHTAPSRLTVGDFLLQWLRDYVATAVRPTTRQGYTMIVEQHLEPAFQNVLLSELAAPHIQSYYARALKSGSKRRKSGLSPTTVLQHHRVLHQALGHAVRWKLLNRNPVEDVDPPRRAEAEYVVYTLEQTRSLLEHTADHPVLRLPVILFTATGMRRGEVLGLQWGDVDWDAKTLQVRRAVTVIKGRLTLGPPKHGTGKLIPLPDYALLALREQHRAQGYPKGAAWVFPGEGEWTVHPDTVSSAFYRVIRTLDLPVIAMKDLRHGHASHLLAAGVHPKVVSERLGHSTIQVTMNTYSHVIPSLQREAAEMMGDLLRRPAQDSEASGTEQ